PLLPSPRSADVVDAELDRVVWPYRLRAERATEWPHAWVIATELVVDSRNPRTSDAPAPVGLQVGGRRDDHSHRLSIGNVGVGRVPVVVRWPSQRPHVGAFEGLAI